SLHRLREHLEPCDVDEAAPPVSAAREQIRKADLVDLAQVRLLDVTLSARDDASDVEREPAHVGDRKLGFEKQRGVRRVRTLTVVADEPSTVGQLHQRTHDMEA